MNVLLLFSRLLLAISISGCIGSCNKSNVGPSTPAPVTPTSANNMTYLALGDSYTIGQSVTAGERFPYLTVQMLRNNGYNFSDPRYIAVTGWTTQNLQDAINMENPAPGFDIVSLLIGVNDQYQHRDTGFYRAGFTANLQKAIMLSGNRPKRVFVLSIPDYSATPFVAASDKARVREQIDQFNTINQEVSAQYGVNYTNITVLSRAAASDPSLLSSDNLHYSAKEHTLWAAQLAEAIRKQLQ